MKINFMTNYLFAGITLPGAMEGLKYYLKPDVSKLLDITVGLENSV